MDQARPPRTGRVASRYPRTALLVVLVLVLGVAIFLGVAATSTHSNPGVCTRNGQVIPCELLREGT